MTEDGAVPPRERGWWGPVLTLVLLLSLVEAATFRLVTPIHDALLLLAPVCAVLAILGWRSGGRMSLAVLWTLFAVWIVSRGARGTPTYAMFGLGWSVLLSVGFGVVLTMTPNAAFLGRALRTLALVGSVGAVAVVVWRGGPDGVAAMLQEESAVRSAASLKEWQDVMASPVWQDLLGSAGTPGWYVAAVEAQLKTWPAQGVRLFPAFLALQSLLTLALGWAVYHRVGRSRVGPPLSPLREFRFDDVLVWGVVVGLLGLALPLGAAWRSLGLNLLVVFGALYALRGLGVLLWFLRPGRWMSGAFVLFSLLFWPVVLLSAAGLGLGDTWFDWRRGPRQQSQRSE